MGIRAYQPIKIPPMLDAVHRNELLKIDSFLRQVSANIARLPQAAQGTPSAGSTAVDLSNYLFLPGRSPEQRARGNVIFSGKSAEDATNLNDLVYRGLVIEGTSGLSPQINHKVYFQPDHDAGINVVRKWIFPSISGSAVDTFTFLSTAGTQTVTNKTITTGSIYVGTAAARNVFVNSNSTNQQFFIRPNSGFPTTSVQTPTLWLPSLNVATPTTNKHSFMMMNTDATAPFTAGSVPFGNWAANEMEMLAPVVAGSLTNGALLQYNSGETVAGCTWTTGTFTITGTFDTTKTWPGMRVVGSASLGIYVDENTRITAVTATTLTVDTALVGNSLGTTVTTFGPIWSTNIASGTLSNYLYLPGRTGGQIIGSGTHAGGTTNDIAIEGRLMLCDVGTTAFQANTKLNVVGNMTVNAITNFVRVVPTLTLTGSSNATFRGLFVNVVGGSSLSSGNPNFTGAQVQVAPTYTLGLGTIIGLEQSVTIPTGNQACARLIASSNSIIGASVPTGLQDVTSATGFLESLTLNRSNYGTFRAFELSTTASGFRGVAAQARLFDFEQAFDTGSFGTAVTITGDLTNLSTNITNITSGLSSAFVGMLVAHANVPTGTFVTIIDTGTSTISMSQAATATVGGASINLNGAVTILSGMYKASAYPSNVRTSRILDLQSDDYSQMYGRFYLRPPTPANYPVPTAYLHIGAGTTAASSAPIKFTSGTSMTAAEAGAVEFTTDDLFFTITTGPARKRVLMAEPVGGLTSGRVPFATTNGRLTDDSDMTFATDTLTVTKIAATQFTGDIQFTGSGVGLPYGSCYGNEIGWTQAAAAAGTFYEVVDTDMTDGELNNVTHDGSGKLTVSIAGRYLINYGVSLEADAANIHLLSAISINGTEIAPGRMHFHRHSASAANPLAGTAIVNLAANDTVEIAVATADAGAPLLSVEHLCFSVVQVGG